MTQEAAAERAVIHAKHLCVIEGGTTNTTVATFVAPVVAYEVCFTTFACHPLSAAATSFLRSPGRD